MRRDASGWTVRLQEPSALVAPMQDQRKGRYSEVGCINGVIVRQGYAIGVLTLFNKSVVELIGRIEKGELDASPKNLTMVKPIGVRATQMS